MFGDGKNLRAFETVNLLLGIPVSGELITVRVEKVAGGLAAEVKNPLSNVTVMSLPLASLNNIAKLLKTVGQYLSANPSVRQSLEAPVEAPVLELNDKAPVA